MSRVDLGKIDAKSTLNLLTSLIIDDVTYSEVPRAKAREHIRGLIEEQANVLRLLEMQADVEARRKRELSVEEQSAHMRAVEIAGGPVGSE